MPRTRKVPLPDGTAAEGEVVGFQSHGEHWNEYLLDDGALLKMKLVVTEVVRLEGHYDAAGNPVYIVHSTNVLSADVPDELKRPGGDQS
jgi:hypothetical protein